MTVEPLRLAFRKQVRDRALEHARQVVVTSGWDGVRMADVASATGVSRPTIYKEFGDRQGLGEALVLQETERFLLGVQKALEAEQGDGASALVTAVLYALEEANRSPLLHAVLTSTRNDDAGLLPLLTTRSQPLLDASHEVVQQGLLTRFPDADEVAVADAADALVRLVVSHLVQPAADAEQTALRLVRIVLRNLGEPAAVQLPRHRQSRAG